MAGFGLYRAFARRSRACEASRPAPGQARRPRPARHERRQVTTHRPSRVFRRLSCRRIRQPARTQHDSSTSSRFGSRSSRSGLSACRPDPDAVWLLKETWRGIPLERNSGFRSRITCSGPEGGTSSEQATIPPDGSAARCLDDNRSARPLVSPHTVETEPLRPVARKQEPVVRHAHDGIPAPS